MFDLFPMPLGLLQSAPGNWPTAILVIAGWAKMGGLIWAFVALLKSLRGHGEMGEKFNEALIPGLAFVILLAPDLLMRLLGVGQNSSIMTLLSSWQLIP